MTSTRTDIHRPSAPEFDPTAYECLGIFDLETDPLKGGSTPDERRYRMQLVNDLRAKGNRPGEPRYGAGQCGHCGAHLRYTALMLHGAAREFIWVGEDCLDNRFALESAAEFKRLREQSALNRERVAKRTKIDTLVAEHPLLAWLTYPGAFVGIEVPDRCWSPYGDGRCWAQVDYDNPYGDKSVPLADCTEVHTKFVLGNDFLRDVGHRFCQYGELSPKQIAAVEAAIPRWTAKVDERLARMADDAAKGPGRWLATEGEKKVPFTGKIIILTQDDDPQYGPSRFLILEGVGEYADVTVKIVGRSAWLWDVERGDTVSLVGTVRPEGKGHVEYQGRRQTSMLRTHGTKIA